MASVPASREDRRKGHPVVLARTLKAPSRRSSWYGYRSRGEQAGGTGLGYRFLDMIMNQRTERASRLGGGTVPTVRAVPPPAP